jgi:hypothetical protein
MMIAGRLSQIMALGEMSPSGSEGDEITRAESGSFVSRSNGMDSSSLYGI